MTTIPGFKVKYIFFRQYRVKYSSKGLIPRKQNSSGETVYAKYGWLGMNDSTELSQFFFAFAVSKLISTHWRSDFFSREE